MDLSVNEVLASEFAMIDNGDGTTQTQRGIGSFNYDMNRTYPAKLSLIWDFKPADSGSIYTYYSSQVDSMGSFLDLNLTLQNESGAVVENFYGVYAEDVSIDIDYTLIAGTLTGLTPIFLDSATNTNLTNVMDIANKIQYSVEQELFVKGVGGKNLKVNFNRDASIVFQPIKWRLLSLNASTNISNILGSENTPKEVVYLYVRSHAPTQSTSGDSFDAKIYYEVYCKNCNKNIFDIENLQESYDDIYWYILDSYPSSCTFSGAKGLYSSSLVQSSNSIDTLGLKAPKMPYIDKVVYSPALWLVYNRFNSSATEHSFKVEFTSSNQEWAGKGDVGLTIDKDISNGRYQKMDW